MLTTRGWALAAGNLALLIAGRLFGVRELFELGLGLATLVIAACIIVRRGSHETRLSRAVEPVEGYPGTLVRVEVSIRAGAHRSPPLIYVEELPADLADGLAEATGAEGLPNPGTVRANTPARRPGRRPKEPSSDRARTIVRADAPDQGRRPGRRAVAFPVGGIEAREVHHIAYRVVPPTRGRYEIGPGSTVVTDPFGVARAPDRPLARSFLLVFPVVEHLLPMATASPHSAEGQPRPLAPTPAGEEFFTMREYQPGDDVKKIHWRSTARAGRLMVRQEDRPAEPRAMVLLDDRRKAHVRRVDGADSFEACVSSAASLVNLYGSQGLDVGLGLASRMGARLEGGVVDAFVRRTAAGEGFGKGPDHQRELMQRLALVNLSGSGDMAASIRDLLDPRTGATYLVIVTTEIDPAWDLASAAGTRLEAGLPVVVVRHLRHTFQAFGAEAEREEEEHARGAAVMLERYGAVVVDVRAGETLKPAWEQRAGGRARAETGGLRGTA